MTPHALAWPDALRRNAQHRPDAVALVFEGERLTHADLLRRAEALAAGLAAAGVGRGDRVAVLAQNRPEILDLLNVCALLGAILLPVNWRLSAEEVRYILADGAPAAVVAEPDLLPAAQGGELPSVRAWYAFDGGPPNVRPYAELGSGQAPAAPTVVLGPDEPLVIIHTAAVAGQPRGAVLTHGNLLAQAWQTALAWGLGPTDVVLVALPLFHIAGLGLAASALAAGGACAILRRFDPAAAVAAVAAERVTVLNEFAPMLGQLLDAAGPTPEKLASLRAVWGLDAPDTIARFEAACRDARFWAGFGQSETSGFVTFSPHRERPGSAGQAGPLAIVAVVDEADAPVPAGTVGEIVVRGPLVFAGYWGRDADTAETFRGGWHHTGDLGRFDPDGYLHYAGRSPAKELIKTGGENVYPAEVERTLRAHPAVAEAVVFGVPDPHWGEAVKAVCVLRPEAPAASPDELIAFVGERIARYKRPKTVVLAEALPRTEAGALDRAAVNREHGGAG